MSRRPAYFGDDDPIKEDDDRLANRPFDFRAPIRTGVRVDPLIGGAAAYAALSDAVGKAKRFVYLSGWTLEADQKTPAGVAWADLLARVAVRADVRVLLTDLDPIGNHPRHAINWGTYRKLVALQQTLPAKRKGALQVVVSLHSWYADLNLIPLGLADLLAPQALVTLRRESAGLLRNLKNLPLVWRNVRRNEKSGRLELAPDDQLDLRSYPASHHQKFCVVDGLHAFAGGIDIASGRADAKGWRDAHCHLQGTIVGDVEAAFAERWNRERVRFERFLAKASRDLAGFSKSRAYRLPPAEPITAVAVSPLPPAKDGAPPARPPGTALAQMRRTVTRAEHRDEDLEEGRRSAPFVFADLKLDEAWKTYERAIGVAERFVYIENQYVREPRLEGLIGSRLASVPELVAIIVTPQRVEEKDKLFTPHGNFLQSQIMKSLGSRFGEQGRFGAFQVRAFRPYLHSKVLVVDDVFAVIGSANANPRSFGLDSELDIAWYDKPSVHAFRLRLWASLLGMSAAEVNRTPPRDAVRLFNRVGRESFRTGGLIVPYKPLPQCSATSGPCEARNELLDIALPRVLL